MRASINGKKGENLVPSASEGGTFLSNVISIPVHVENYHELVGKRSIVSRVRNR